MCQHTTPYSTIHTLREADPCGLGRQGGHTIYRAIDMTNLAGPLVLGRVAVISCGRAVPLVWQGCNRSSVLLAFADFPALLEQVRTPVHQTPRSSCWVTVVFVPPRGNMLNRLLTTKDVASYLQVDPNTVYRWCREGKLAGIKVGRDWRIDQRDLEAFLTAHKNGGHGSTSLKVIFRRRLTAPEHLLVMLTDPTKVYEIEVEFFRVAVEWRLPIFKGCWWQHPDDVRQHYVEAGLPVESLEAQGKLAVRDFWAAYRSGGAQGVLDLWTLQADFWRGDTFWASGSHLLDQWQDNWDSFFDYESRLHYVLCQLRGIVLCPCVTTPAVAEGTSHLLNLAAHHHGILLLTEQNPMLMRLVA